MAYIVKCTQCGEINGGSQLRCVKCQASLIGVPREQYGTPLTSLASTQETADSRMATPGEKPLQKIGRLALLSLCLGSLGLIVFYVTIYILLFYRPVYNFLSYEESIQVYFSSNLITLGLGLAGLVTGVTSRVRRLGRNGSAAGGILLGILSMLSGGFLPVLFLLF